MTMMMSKKAAAVAAAALLLGAAGSPATAATVTPPPPSTGLDWISLSEGIEFQPASVEQGEAATNPEYRHRLRQAQDRFLAEQSSSSSTSHQKNVEYVDSAETYYDGYAQAWRYVGFYTDCSPNQSSNSDYYNDRRKNRDLNSADDQETPCYRYLLWAAYVDLSYSGLGIGEYQFYDTYSKKWDTTACETINNGVSAAVDGETGEKTKQVDHSACKKMDCHLQSSNFQLLGYFKEVDYMDWFEQLFKHEGYCVWQKNEYNFMYYNYYAWPQYCTATSTTLSDGTLLYYDTKAIANANMTYGLYTDSRCSMDYHGDEVTMESVLLSGNGRSGSQDEDDTTLLSLAYLDQWNEAMEIYKVCQPCRAYMLHQTNYNNNYNNNNNNNNNRQLATVDANGDAQQQEKAGHRHRRLEDYDSDYDPNNGLFLCYDAAGYTNVNQCMKFRTKTYMSYATLEEVMEAAQQGGITSVHVHGRTYGTSSMSSSSRSSMLEVAPDWTFLYTGVAVLALGLAILMAAMIWTKKSCCRSSNSIASLNEPLI